MQVQLTFDTKNKDDIDILRRIFVEREREDVQAEAVGTSNPAVSTVSAAPAGARAFVKPSKSKPVETPKVAVEHVIVPVKLEEKAENEEIQPVEPEKSIVEQVLSPDAEPTLDDVRAALQALTQSKGIQDGIGILKKFNATRVSELKPEHFNAFVAQCRRST